MQTSTLVNGSTKHKASSGSSFFSDFAWKIEYFSPSGEESFSTMHEIRNSASFDQVWNWWKWITTHLCSLTGLRISKGWMVSLYKGSMRNMKTGSLENRPTENTNDFVLWELHREASPLSLLDLQHWNYQNLSCYSWFSIFRDILLLNGFFKFDFERFKGLHTSNFLMYGIWFHFYYCFFIGQSKGSVHIIHHWLLKHNGLCHKSLCSFFSAFVTQSRTLLSPKLLQWA